MSLLQLRWQNEQRQVQQYDLNTSLVLLFQRQMQYNTGQRESYKMIESHPPIISRDEFDRVQAEKAKRQRNKASKVE